MRVAVTGAGGFVGYAVAAALVERGHDVRGLVRGSPELPAGVEPRRADLSGSLTDDLAGADAVCHLAALGRVRDSRADPIGYWRTNLGGTLAVLEALMASSHRPTRLVLASTASVYGEPDTQPITEDASTAPAHPYGASKLAADLAAQGVAETGALGAISLRAFNIAGAWNNHGDTDTTRLIPRALAAAANRGPELIVNGDGSAVRDFVHVRDMADAFVRAVDTCTPGRWAAYNIGSGQRTSVQDVIATAEEITGRRIAVHHRDAAPEPAELLADSTRAHEDLGWKPEHSSLREILRDAWTALNRQYADGEYSSSG